MRVRRRARWLGVALGSLLLAYGAGFWGVVLLIRSETESLRVAGLNIDHAAYAPLVRAGAEGGPLRRLAVARFRWLCRGHEARCVVGE